MSSRFSDEVGRRNEGGKSQLVLRDLHAWVAQRDSMVANYLLPGSGALVPARGDGQLDCVIPAAQGSRG